MEIITSIWNTALITPILNLLVILYHYLGNLGLAIIILTLISKVVLTPTLISSRNSFKKQKELLPELQKIKKKYKNDQQKLAKAQMDLYKEHGINPASGCITQLPMIIILLALYRVITLFSGHADISLINAQIYFEMFKIAADTFNTNFLYLDLSNHDPYYVLPVLAGIFQFLSSKFMLQFSLVGTAAAEKTPDKKDDIAYNVQQQMIYIMPIMFVVIGLKLPSGVVLYLLVSALFSWVQTYFMYGTEGTSQTLDSIKKLLGR